MLTDYQDCFCSKWNAEPYRSGYDHSLLKTYFEKYSFHGHFVRMSDVDFRKDWHDCLVLYTSSEHVGFNYKSYIEDVVLGLELNGAHCLPSYPFLRANNNKVFMEVLRRTFLDAELCTLDHSGYGCLEELNRDLQRHKWDFPVVIKSAEGAMSRGVKLAETPEELREHAKELSRTPHWWYEFKDFVREWKMPGYRKESRHQKKFIVQDYIPGLENDWKVLVYGDRFYVLKRHVRDDDFRASGSGVDYQAGSDAGIPSKVLDVVEAVYLGLDEPHLSVDVGFDGEKVHVFEIQALHFGTSTQYKSEEHYRKVNGQWEAEDKDFDQEEAYVWGVKRYLERHPELA